MDESSSHRQPNFSQEETDILVREVQARSGRIYGHANRPPRADDAKAAWEEIKDIVNQACPDILRTAAQCKKRFNDVRRRAKKKLSEQRRQTMTTGGGPSTSMNMTSAEDIASSTLSAVSVEGFGGIEVGITVMSVMKVTASDADNPTYGSSARVVYSVLDGEKFFTVDNQTGAILTAVGDLNRETQDCHELVVKATDMAGQMGGLSSSTTVTIVITDVNDNPPRFPQKMYQFTVSEGAAVGTPVGRVMASDADMGENTDMSYHIKHEKGGELFQVTSDGDTQEAVIAVRKMTRTSEPTSG